MADLTDNDLEHMKNHKYKSTGYTYLDNKINPFWEWCAKKLPYNFTPNMVTTSGFICQMISIIVIANYDLTFSDPLGPCVYFLCAFMLFMAQTLDAIDGKHARATNRCSSLGQLMDHGCDAMDNFLFVIVIAQAHLLGSSMSVIVFQVLIQLILYSFNLEEYITGYLRTNVSNVGCTEYQWFAMFLCIFPAIFGHKLSLFEIKGIRLTTIILAITGLNCVYVIFYVIREAIKKYPEKKKEWLHFVVFLVFCAVELLSGKLILYEEKPFMIILLNGLFCALLTCRLIIDTMAHRKFKLIDVDYGVYIVGILLALMFNNIFVEIFVIYILFAYVLISFYYKVIYAIYRLMDYLKIPF